MPETRRLPQDPRFLPPTPFARMVVAHAVAACGDGCIAVSLAGSLFFQGATSGSREKVLLYLLLSMAPFVVVAGVLGSMIDRTQGGRRLLVVASVAGRSLLALVMSQFITKGAPEGLLVYPLAFGVLVLQKGYSVAKSSLVPALVADDRELVKANSRLALVSTIAGFVGVGGGGLLQLIFDADWSLMLGAIVFSVAAYLAVKIPRVGGVTRQQEELERAELHQPSILVAASAMALLRGSVGFFAFFTAFSLRNDLPALGVAGGLAAAGAFCGNALAPYVRERMREEVILNSSMGLAALLVALGALTRGVVGFGLAGLGLALGAACGKLGFDSLLQRDGPDAARGRAFARFETRFQLAWVLGALLGIIPAGKEIGLVCLGLALTFGAVSYYAALRAARARVYRTTIRPKAVDRAFDRAREELRGRRARGRSARAAQRDGSGTQRDGSGTRRGAHGARDPGTPERDRALDDTDPGIGRVTPAGGVGRSDPQP